MDRNHHCTPYTLLHFVYRQTYIANEQSPFTSWPAITKGSLTEYHTIYRINFPTLSDLRWHHPPPMMRCALGENESLFRTFITHQTATLMSTWFPSEISINIHIFIKVVPILEPVQNTITITIYYFHYETPNKTVPKFIKDARWWCETRTKMRNKLMTYGFVSLEISRSCVEILGVSSWMRGIKYNKSLLKAVVHWSLIRDMVHKRRNHLKMFDSIVWSNEKQQFVGNHFRKQFNGIIHFQCEKDATTLLQTNFTWKILSLNAHDTNIQEVHRGNQRLA